LAGILYNARHDYEVAAHGRDGIPKYEPITGNLVLFGIHKIGSKGMWQWWHFFFRDGIDRPK